MDLKYIVYITINLCNGKFYIGVHKTNPEIFDGYIGLGVYRQSLANGDYPFHRAVRKYGYKNFKRTTIKIFPGTEEGRKAAYELEATLVNETLLKSKSVYNIALGGFGSVNPENKQKVYMFSLDGEYLKTFKDVKEAAMFIVAKDISNDVYTTLKAIRNNCLGTTSSSMGYYWSYIKEFKYTESKKLIKVSQYTLSGKFLRYFDSITEASVKLGLTSIDQAIRKGFSCGGYQWKYYTGDSSDIPPLVNLKTWSKVAPIIISNKNKTIVEEFACVEECVKKHPEFQITQISRVLRGIIKTHKGFSFKFKDDDIVKLL